MYSSIDILGILLNGTAKLEEWKAGNGKDEVNDVRIFARTVLMLIVDPDEHWIDG
jgi:hypothetical protein